MLDAGSLDFSLFYEIIANITEYKITFGISEEACLRYTKENANALNQCVYVDELDFGDFEFKINSTKNVYTKNELKKAYAEV